ncbi:hypothetical protein N665_0432s0002 [Sinapis alba]|nr:hypothetical protein N665_0432s0002 [Sinapis alba]
MGKRKKPKQNSRASGSPCGSSNCLSSPPSQTSGVNKQVASVSASSTPVKNAQEATVTSLAIVNPMDLNLLASSIVPFPANVTAVSLPVTAIGHVPAKARSNPSAQAANASNPEIEITETSPTGAVKPTIDCVDKVKGKFKKLEKKGTTFTLPLGEACVKIPNSVIENNKKGWESFIIGQFYSDPPAQSLIHNITNGIWRKRFRDITVSKLEGFTFLFRIPNASTRTRVLNQRLWQIEGHTMFVADWEPGVILVKPELSSAPIWLELRDVPFQFFNEEGLERIVSRVGHPQFLHQSTANKTNLEVAKVFTVVDPRVPLPEAVNVQFESGDIRRIRVSSPWMPPVCVFCKEAGHT